MEVKEKLKLNIQIAINKLGVTLDLDKIDIDNSRDLSHGDYASNVALKNSRLFNKPARELAELIIKELDMSEIEKVEIAGPGFINFYIKKDSITSVVGKIIEQGDNFGRGESKNFKINVEFVSANPTGLLHVGTARGAAIGDSIARILEFDGYTVTREYYINDAGVQITHLGESIEERYKQLLGLPFELPEDGYHGEDVFDIAKQLKAEFGDNLLSRDDHLQFFMQKGMEIELDRIKKHLDAFRVKFDVFSSEKTIRSNGAI